MKMLFVLLVATVAAGAQASTLLFTNNVPADQTGATYLAGVQAIANAMDAGARLHVADTWGRYWYQGTACPGDAGCSPTGYVISWWAEY